jgi:hypothetical protein
MKIIVITCCYDCPFFWPDNIHVKCIKCELDLEGIDCAENIHPDCKLKDMENKNDTCYNRS